MLNIELKVSTPFLQEKMNLEPYQYVYELTRLRLSNGKPLIYEVSYLPLRFCEGLERFDFNNVSLYETLNQHYNIQITNAYENLVASKLNKKYAALLNGEVDDSCMYIERFSYYGDVLIEYTQSIASGHKYKYKVKLM
ncbi:UTRA domain-containing protein [Staphylococcus lugdunensis]